MMMMMLTLMMRMMITQIIKDPIKDTNRKPYCILILDLQIFMK